MGSVSTNYFDRLSDELILEIFEQANATDISNCRRVCTRFRDLSFDNVLWRRLYSRDFSFTSGLRLEHDRETDCNQGAYSHVEQNHNGAHIDWAKEYQFNTRWKQGRCWTRKKELALAKTMGTGNSVLCLEWYRGYMFSIIHRHPINKAWPEGHLYWALQVWDAKLNSNILVIPLAQHSSLHNSSDKPVGILIDEQHSSSGIIRLAVQWTKAYDEFYDLEPRQNSLSFASSLDKPEAFNVRTIRWSSKRDLYSHYVYPYFGTMQESARDESVEERRSFEITLHKFIDGKFEFLCVLEFPGEISEKSRLHITPNDGTKEVVATVVWTDVDRNTDSRMVAAREFRVDESGRLLKDSTTIKYFDISTPENTDPRYISFHYAHPHGVLNGSPMTMFKLEPSTADTPLAINLVGIAYKSSSRKDGRGLASAHKIHLNASGRMITCGIAGTRMRVYSPENGYLTSTPFTSTPVFRLKSRYVRYFDGVDVAQFEDQQENEQRLDSNARSRRDKCVRPRRHDPRWLMSLRFDDERIVALYRANTVAQRGFVFFVQIFDFDEKHESEKIASMNWEDYWERPVSDLSKKWGKKAKGVKMVEQAC